MQLVNQTRIAVQLRQQQQQIEQEKTKMKLNTDLDLIEFLYIQTYIHSKFINLFIY